LSSATAHHSRGKKTRAALLAGAAAVFLLIVFAVWCNIAVDSSALGSVYTSSRLIPRNEVGVVLGCPVTNRDGSPNLYYASRIDAAAALYHAGRVAHLVVSGFPGQPRRMKTDLAALGVPPERITEDNAGYRTLASVIRARDIFGLRRCTIITQPGHATRAIYLAKAYGLEAVAFAADDPKQIGAAIREYLAHVKAVLDVHILHRNARDTGKKTPIRLPEN